MKMLAEYLENAIRFEKMAAEESDPKLKADFEKQAASYRKLAEKRAKGRSTGSRFRRRPKAKPAASGHCKSARAYARSAEGL